LLILKYFSIKFGLDVSNLSRSKKPNFDLFSTNFYFPNKKYFLVILNFFAELLCVAEHNLSNTVLTIINCCFSKKDYHVIAILSEWSILFIQIYNMIRVWRFGFHRKTAVFGLISVKRENGVKNLSVFDCKTRPFSLQSKRFIGGSTNKFHKNNPS